MDLGASGGKVFLGNIQNDDFKIKEIYRFDNRPILEGGRYLWDIGYIYKEVIQGLRETQKHVSNVASIGIDSWGVDFGLIGMNGNLIKNPYSYRDRRVSSTIDHILKKISKRELFTITGINHWSHPQSLWQYHYLSRDEPRLLHRTRHVLMIPQLISFMLGGGICAEETLASTTQMMDIGLRDWSDKITGRLDLPLDKLPKIKKSGVKIGVLKNRVVADTKIKADIVLPSSHDTAAAVAGMPLKGKSKAFLSTGTWFVVGLELDKPCLTEEAFGMGASNEVGVENSIRFLKNVTGFFLLEQCREGWKEKGQTYSYDGLLKKALKTRPFGSLIDPDDPSFTVEVNMPSAIATYCQKTRQEAPRSEGEITRCIFESIAVKTALTLEKLMGVTGSVTRRLHLGGGCVRNDLLCQMISSATSLPLDAGLEEAAAVGNLLVQANTYSEIKDITDGRRLVGESMGIKKFEPEEDERWGEVKERMKRLIGQENY